MALSYVVLNKGETSSTYVKIFKKTTFLTPKSQGVRNVSFLENFAYVLNRWPPRKTFHFQTFKNIYHLSFKYLFLSLKYKYLNAAKGFILYILILTSTLVVLHLLSHSNFLVSVLLLKGDVEINSGCKFISKKVFQSVP